MRLSPVAIEKMTVLRATPLRLGASRGGASVGCGGADRGREARGRCGRRVHRTAPGLSRRYTSPSLMANIASQKKRILRAERERLENRRYTSTIKTFFRRLETSAAGDDDATADADHRALVSLIDKAVKRGALHKNTGSRKKARAARVRAGQPE